MSFERFIFGHVKPYCDAGTIGGIAVKIQVAPGPDWYNEYLRKEENVKVISTLWDDEHIDKYFPDDATQKLLQESKGKGIGNNWGMVYLIVNS